MATTNGSTQEIDKEEEPREDKRNRTATEKGESLRFQKLEEDRKAAGATLRKQITKVSTLLVSQQATDARSLEKERDILDKLRDRLNDAQTSYYEELRDIEERNEAYQWFDTRDREYLQCRTKVTEAIQCMEKEASDKAPLVSSISRSSKYTSSSVRSRRAKAAARAACLEVEMDFLERETEYKKLLMQKEIAKAKAEEEAMRKFEEDDEGKNKHNFPIHGADTKLPFKEEQQESSEPKGNGVLNPNASPFEPFDNKTQHTSTPEIVNYKADELNSVVKLVAEQQRLSLLPTQEPPMFSGNCFEFASFINTFESLIESRVLNPKQRLYYLNQYTTGEAKEAIKGFIALDSQDCYDKAKGILKERFGHPYRISQAYKEKLSTWLPIREGDGANLLQFSDFLVLCEQAMKTLKYMESLNSEDTLKKITSKLPKQLSLRWCRFANKMLRNKDRMATFHDVVMFVKEEAQLATDPVFSPENLKECRKYELTTSGSRELNKRSSVKVNKSSNNFATTSSPCKEQAPWRSISCSYCKNTYHDLENCPSFAKKTLQERKLFVQDSKLCFGCLRAGHVSKTCRNRRECKTCGKSHPTVLHDETKNTVPASDDHKDKGEATNSCTTTCNVTGSSCITTNAMIIPVRLHHYDNPQREVTVYALLDPASNGTFIKEGILQELQLSGSKTQLQLNTMHGSEVISTLKVDGLIVERMDRRVQIELPKTYTRKEIPSKRTEIPRPESAEQWPHLSRIASKIYPFEESLEVGLLIGSNCPSAIKPKQVIPGRSSDPYAIRTVLGWGIIGPITGGPNTGESDILCNRLAVREIGNEEPSTITFLVETQVKEIISPEAVRNMFELDFSEEKGRTEKTLSIDDQRFMAMVTEGIKHRSDGHYELPFPLRRESLILPNNESLASRRLQHLKGRFRRDEGYKQQYIAFMNDMIDKGYAEKVSPHQEDSLNGKIWYLPHHGVFHPRKPGKIRVVFDCSAEFRGESLNKYLLQGPDLSNKLAGVLCRFRQETVAFMADIEGMFLQVHVSQQYRDLLRFLWWEDDDMSKEPSRYRMTVHLFGAGSSPGCCNFTLKKLADDFEEEIGSEPAEFLRKDFYVDDGLKSVPSVDKAKELIRKTKEMCRRGGFNLHKFVTNKREVLEDIPLEDRSKGVAELNLEKDKLPIERALGVCWCIESDTFKFRIALQDRPFTRRGVLSAISSIYDPHGFLAPLLLPGKGILQELCKGKVGWDDPIPETMRPYWARWRNELRLLEDFKVPRCFKPEGFGAEVSVQLHHFSDASTVGYGQCSFLRLQNARGEIHCSLVMGKAKVAPLKMITTPRLELTAAVVSTKVSAMLRKELQYKDMQEIFWTDSKVVLGYIKNESKRFHVFVANRVQQIRDQSSPEQWRHVETRRNPADDASRGLTAKELLDNPRWISGPEFLWKSEDAWPRQVEDQDLAKVLAEDPELKKVTSHAASSQETWSLLESLSYFSDWHRARKAVATCLRYKQRLRELANLKQGDHKRMKEEERISTRLSVEELKAAEKVILKAVQEASFPKEMKMLTSIGGNEDRQEGAIARQKKAALKTASSLYRLDPFLDDDGILHVGGRIKRGNFALNEKFPIILPRKSHVTSLIIKYFHERVHHQGRGISLNEIRSNGFWVIGGTSAVAYHISKCVTCRKLRGKVEDQKMSDLPEDRLEPAPPFTYCAVDYCGPWYIKEGRKQVKRYVSLFTCMASRAVHLEVSSSLETDSFLNALRRFICRRGPVRQLRSDQGTNFVGAKGELQKALQAMDQDKIGAELLKENCDWLNFKMNPPSASHAGGVWERQVRTIRSVLTALLDGSAGVLDGETFETLICETEAIVNCRPLTVENLSDPDSLSPLTPNHILTMKTKPVLPPPGIFQREDQYSKKRWRRVQHLACQFWDRWRKEYLQSLQERSKWVKPHRNLEVGDVVLTKEANQPRNRWNLARVLETFPSKDGLVRTVKVRVGDSNVSHTGKRLHPPSLLVRPVQKLVLLVPREDRL